MLNILIWKKVATDWKFFSSDAAVFSGSYFKIKQIQLGYTLPKAISSVQVSAIFVYIAHWMISSPSPSILVLIGDRFYNSWAHLVGFDNGTYPTSKKVVFGINVTF